MNLPAFDPTAYDLGYRFGAENDPRIRTLHAVSNYGNHYLGMPFITEVAPNLWHGGVANGLVLPDIIEYKLSLFPWEEYVFGNNLKEHREVVMYDSEDQEFDQIEELATWVNDKRKLGTVLVHCQAGINRSSLVVAKALILSGEVANGSEAIDLMRAKRDPAVLANPHFEEWVRQQ